MYFVRESALVARGWQTHVFNAAYYPLSALPWLLMLNNRILRYGTIALVVVAIFLSTKRTSLLAVVLATTSAFGCRLTVASSLRERVRIVLAALFMLGVGSGAVVLLGFSEMDQSRLFVERLDSTVETGGTRRIDIYQDYIEELSLMSFSELLTGHGFNSGRLILMKSAHNDWLEALYDFGIIDLILYVALHFLLLKRMVELIRMKSFLAEPYAVAYAIFFMMSLTSHLIIYPNYFTVLVAFWGMVEGRLDTNTEGLVEGIASPTSLHQSTYPLL